ncbi:50S ribosomal protein L20, partial [Candidatus Dojkabacteria bacterium]|nr:50S ribosomal protein L20 [Candidatus Dojkabacteria bacterium]
KHKKVLSQTKGFRLSYSKLYRRAKEALLHAGQYSFNDRRKRRNDFRRLWIKRINAALTKHNVRYSQFINKLKVAKVELNRKVLADLALDHPEVFDAVVKEVA